MITKTTLSFLSNHGEYKLLKVFLQIQINFLPNEIQANIILKLLLKCICFKNPVLLYIIQFLKIVAKYVAVWLLQLCQTLRPHGSSVHGILQARTLEMVTISFPRGSSQPRDWTHVSCIAGRFFTTELPGKYTKYT